MIKIFLLLLLILPSQIVWAQNKSKVTLRNGTEIIGSINYYCCPIKIGID